MNKPTLTRFVSQSQQGFSLVELMIAMTIGFLVVAAVGYVYLGSRQTFRMSDSMSRMQENARLAIETLARDVRMAGYVGCGNLQTATITTIANPPVSSISAANAITGLDSGVSTANFLGTTITRPGGDTLSIMGAFGGGVGLVGNLSPSNANVQINGNPFNFAVGDVLVVSDCKNADVFSPTSVSGGGTVTMAHANSTNTGNRVGDYGSDGIVLKMEQYTYFIGINPDLKRALYRTNVVTGVPGGTVELVENVWDMQIAYGMDTNADGEVDSYGDATAVGTNWQQVLSARISLLLVSPEDNIVPSAQTYNFNGASVTATDRRLYQVLTTTIAVRNRAP